MNIDKEFLDLMQKHNKEILKRRKLEAIFKYLKDNLLSIIAIIISAIALFK